VRSLAVPTFGSRFDSITPSFWEIQKGDTEKGSDEYEHTKKLTLELSRVARERLITRSGDGYFENRFVVINGRHVNLRFASIVRFANQKKARSNIWTDSKNNRKIESNCPNYS